MSNLSHKLFNLSDKIINLTNRFEGIPNRIPEIMVLVLFPILVAVFGYFHEPWFDEAQAWQIAKCASFKEILFYLPHFEGHPPLWHLILSVFAKNGFPYEITIKVIAFIFSYISVFLILFKSPFYRIIRVLLPFTYFLFYDSTIISRPYCLVMVAFAILAITYYKKNEKPFQYGLGLILLASTQAFSFVIASFLTLVWFVETIKNKIFNKKHFMVFLLLLIFYITLALILIPSNEASTLHIKYSAGIIRRLIYALFIIPADCFISHICTFLPNDTLSYIELCLGLLISALFWFFMYQYTKKSKIIFFTFLIPYIPFAFLASKYFAIPHMTIPFCFIIFICWITLNHPQKEISENNGINKAFTILIAMSIFIGLYWNFKSCILDIFVPFAKSKKEANFIKEHHLDNYKIMVEWDNNDKEKPHPDINKTWHSISPYFEKNIFYNFNNGDSKKNYVILKDVSDKEIENTYDNWRKQGLPEVIAGESMLNLLYKDKNINKEYILVYYNLTRYIRKGILLSENYVPILVREDIAKELGMQPIEAECKNYKVDLYSITSYLVAKLILWKDEFKEKHKLKGIFK